MATTTIKARTPSRCREWERQRRNKFNDAIIKLGEVVHAINKANDSSIKDADNTHYPKIEIIQKAILCLANCALEKSQLKAEILALEVKLEAEKNNTDKEKKDVSTQVFLGVNKKSRNSKYVKVLMLQKSKNKKPSEVKGPLRESTRNTPMPKLPTLLPSCNNISKKGPQNTFVVLPAAPYILPQRPLLFPTVPPAIVLIESNLQTLNKSCMPVLNRNNSDITKTTMVNILPISAYSHPLSALQLGSNCVKTKKVSNKKSNKKCTKTIKHVTEKLLSQLSSYDKSKQDIVEDKSKETKTTNISKEDTQPCEKSENIPVVETTLTKKDDSKIIKESIINRIEVKRTDRNEFKQKLKNTNDANKNEEESNVVPTVLEENASLTIPTVNIDKATNVSNTNSNIKTNKAPEKITSTEDKDKENKLPNILDTSLCENVVDAGNARLELAEEFLAASPTAAFLMSFPLVSGNRADSPAEEPQSTIQTAPKPNEGVQRRTDISTQSSSNFDKSNQTKPSNKTHTNSAIISKTNEQQKYVDNNTINKQTEPKTSSLITKPNVSTENPFLNLPMPTLISTNCALADPTFTLDFDCNISKSVSNPSTTYNSSNSFFYKSDPFSTVKNTIYSTSSISSGHEFNSLSLYPCAMDKYTSKTKSDYTNVEDNLMKIGSSRLTYDIDLGWSHKSLDFVNCTTSTNTFNKDSILTSSSTSYASTYNPFNPEFHMPLVTNTNKKDPMSSKPTSSFPETITSFYSQTNNLWSDDAPFYTNNVSKSITNKHQNYLPIDHTQTNINPKINLSKQFEPKHTIPPVMSVTEKPANLVLGQQIVDKFQKKSPSKMHINWMTSEIRPMQNNCTPSHTNIKGNQKYGPIENITKRQDTESNYFPISMHNFPTQTTQEEFQVWPSSRPAGTTEITIEPPPINLPTLIGDLALGPHDKKKNSDATSRVVSQKDIQNCNNFLSVTQLMNRSSDNMPPSYPGTNETQKLIQTKQNINQITNDTSRKTMTARFESHLPQPCYVFNDPKLINSYDNVGQFPQVKSKTSKIEKNVKLQKNNYSAESLIRGGTCTQKNVDDNGTKFLMPSQKYNDFNTAQDVAQVSHFPIIDYSDNSYAGQQFSGTTLYNSTTNTIPNSFYTNFMPGSSNLMSTNYTNGPFSGDFIDYNQTADCNYSNHKYDELKIRNNTTVFQHDKMPSNYKTSRRESASKHKLECSKKDSSKKYQSKRAKPNNDAEEWTDSSHLLWQNKVTSKRHPNFSTEELPLPNYVSNQMTAQYQSDYFNSHLVPSNVQPMSHNVDRTLSTFPVTSRANFNLSTIFPEITMKVQ